MANDSIKTNGANGSAQHAAAAAPVRQPSALQKRLGFTKRYAYLLCESLAFSASFKSESDMNGLQG